MQQKEPEISHIFYLVVWPSSGIDDRLYGDKIQLLSGIYIWNKLTKLQKTFRVERKEAGINQ